MGISLEGLPSLHGVPSRQSIRNLLPASTDAEVDFWAKKIDQLEVEDTEGIFLLPGARELFAFLDEAGIEWMVVTSCTRALGTRRAHAVGLELPAKSVFFDDVKQGKPFPEPYLLGLSRLNLPAEKVVVLEDAPSGITSGKAAGIDVIAMVTTHVKDSLQDADHIAESLFEIPSLLA
jgi:sugar-phosphatase